MKTFLGAPLRHRDEKLGNVYLTEKAEGIEFTPEDEALLVLFVAHAASAIYNARLHQRVEAERSRAEAERKHLDALVNTSPMQDTIVRRRPDGREYPPEEFPIQRALQRGERGAGGRGVLRISRWSRRAHLGQRHAHLLR
jgi:GAF domain-containing protein